MRHAPMYDDGEEGGMAAMVVDDPPPRRVSCIKPSPPPAIPDRRKAIRIIDAVCSATGIMSHSLAGRSRRANCVDARELVAVLCRRHTKLSFPAIAEAMGKVNHSGVMVSYKRGIARIERDAAMRAMYEALEAEIG